MAKYLAHITLLSHGEKESLKKALMADVLRNSEI